MARRLCGQSGQYCQNSLRRCSAVLCTTWYTRWCHLHYWEVLDPVVWSNQPMHRHWQGQEETLRKEEQCAAHPSNIGSSGGTCQEGSVSRWTCVESEVVSYRMLLPALELPPPTNWGWSRTGEGQYTPYWTRLPEEAHSCIELVSQKCKKGCVRCCKCKKAALQCAALCVCEGDCTWRWVHNIHVLEAMLNLLTWHCLCTRIFSTGIYLASNTRPLYM